MDTLLNGFEDLCNGGRQGFPGVLLGRELLASALGQLVVLGAAIVVGSAPARFDPAAALEAVEGRIKRTLLDAENLARDLLDAFGDGPAVLRTQGECAEDEKVERALRKNRYKELACSPLSSTGKCTSPFVEAQGEPSSINNEIC
jgi:hypothetical protein